MPMETRHDLEHTTERLTEGLRCPWKWGPVLDSLGRYPSLSVRRPARQMPEVVDCTAQHMSEAVQYTSAESSRDRLILKPIPE